MMIGMVSGPVRTRLPVATGLAMSALTVALLVGCSGDPVSPPTTSADGRSVALRLDTVGGSDDLDARTRTRLETQVGDALSRYVVGAYLGDFPRLEFVAAFEPFTSGAAREATRDIEVLTAARAQDAQEVQATKLDADLAFLVVDEEAVSAAATVDFAFEASFQDGETRTLWLRGRILLERLGSTWSIFGYDVSSEDGLTGRSG